MAFDIIVYAENKKDGFKRSVLEAVSEGRRLADTLGSELCAVVIGSDVGALAPALGEFGADLVLVAEDEGLGTFSPDGYCDILERAITQKSSSIVLLDASIRGKELAAKLSARLSAGLATECVNIEIKDGTQVVATRPLYAGKALVDVAFNSPIRIMTLRPKAFVASEAPREAAIERMEHAPDEGRTGPVIKETIDVGGGKIDLREADIIVSGGRGMKNGENFAILEEFADLLGGVVGASRSAVDAGWRPHSDQVGQTGKVVSPSLYVACGISGQIQHLVGMNTSKNIVAINKEPDAPIFAVADYGIVGDLFDVVPALTEEARRLRS